VKKLKRYQYERYAVLCNLAYSKVLKQTRYGFSPKGQRVVFNRFGQPMMRVLWHDDHEEVIVVIKGSHNLPDWLLNLALWKRNLKQLGLDYSVHAGFRHQILQQCTAKHPNDLINTSVYTQLMSILEPLLSNGKRVTFTGHSSGGAISCILADALEKKHTKSVKRIVTFGQPAFGGYAMTRNYKLKHKTYRICCDLDIVTFLPPIPGLYLHIGKLLWLYNGKIYENTSTVVRLGRSITSWVLRPFSYHLMSKYIRNKDFFDER
tara:strand:- start:400 stop:1188 length:789 start_codon:yes stop_codon:yes gene_type:complete